MANSSNSSSKISFLELYAKGHVVMNNAFLSCLQLHEIFRLSMTCSSMKKMIDPASVKSRRRTRRQKNQKMLSKAGSAAANSFHLKRIASFQLLGVGLDETLDHSRIDAIFGVDVRRLTDFAKLRGEKYKEQIAAILDQEPSVDKYCRNPRDADHIKRYWQVHGSSLHQLKHFSNPLQAIIDKTKVSYTRGGIFRLRNIKYFQNVFLDYEIMIDNIENADDYQLLRQIEERGMKEDKLGGDDPIQLKDVGHILNGVGRMYQYSKDNTLNDFDVQNLDQLVSLTGYDYKLYGVHDGQIKNGYCDGFGVRILLKQEYHQIGYFKSGYQCGKIIYMKGVRDVRSIYDAEKMGFGECHNQFTPGTYSEMDLAENVSEARMHEIRQRILDEEKQKNDPDIRAYRQYLYKEWPHLYKVKSNYF